jgi:hypothetical protein
MGHRAWPWINPGRRKSDHRASADHEAKNERGEACPEPARCSDRRGRLLGRAQSPSAPRIFREVAAPPLVVYDEDPLALTAFLSHRLEPPAA